PLADAGAPDPLSIIPPEANLLVHVTFGELANIGPIRDTLEAVLKGEEHSKILAEAGFDPISHLRGIWVASLLEGEKKPLFLLVLEGTFDREKTLSGLKKASVVHGSPRQVGRLQVYEGQRGEETEGYLTFLSDEQILLGEKVLFNKALKLVDGGESVRANQKLKMLSKDFGGGGLAWAAACFPPEVLKSLSPLGAAPPGDKVGDEKQAGEKREGDKVAEEKGKKPVSLVPDIPNITGVL